MVSQSACNMGVGPCSCTSGDVCCWWHFQAVVQISQVFLEGLWLSITADIWWWPPSSDRFLVQLSSCCHSLPVMCNFVFLRSFLATGDELHPPMPIRDCRRPRYAVTAHCFACLAWCVSACFPTEISRVQKILRAIQLSLSCTSRTKSVSQFNYCHSPQCSSVKGVPREARLHRGALSFQAWLGCGKALQCKSCSHSTLRCKKRWSSTKFLYRGYDCCLKVVTGICGTAVLEAVTEKWPKMWIHYFPVLSFPALSPPPPFVIKGGFAKMKFKHFNIFEGEREISWPTYLSLNILWFLRILLENFMAKTV